MSDVVEALRANPHFTGLGEPEARLLLSRAQPRTWSAGDTVIVEGTEGASLLVIESGELEVSRAGKALATLGTGACLGEMALLDPAPRSATVTARSEVTASELSREDLWGMLAEGEKAAIQLLQGLSGTVCARLAECNRLVQDEVLKPDTNVFKRLWNAVRGGK